MISTIQNNSECSDNKLTVATLEVESVFIVRINNFINFYKQLGFILTYKNSLIIDEISNYLIKT